MTNQRFSFDLWMKQCDVVMQKISPFSIRELADATWRDWYDDEMTPKEAVQTYIDNECDDLLCMYLDSVVA